MKILLIDLDKDGVNFSLRCMAAGHIVKVWFPEKTEVGKGLITIVPDWRPHMRWADLIFITGNSKLGDALEPFYKAGYPILGPNKLGAELELDRCKGQEFFEANGIDTLPYEVFSDYNKAIAFVKAEKKAYVVKPWGGTADKALSYVPPRGYEVDAMVYKLGRWKEEGLKGDFMLQECVRGTEMGVSGWFGPGGFNQWIEEDWEEKKFMSGGLGCNTGEQGTIIRHVKHSKLFDKMLKPLSDALHEIDYVGNINVNCGIVDDGKPYPYELTMRPGWPDFNLLMAVIQGDPAEWMADLLQGKDTLVMSPKVCVGVVMTHGDYPVGEQEDENSQGFPIYGITEDNENSLHPCLIRAGKDEMETAGNYPFVVTGLGDTVRSAAKKAYAICKDVKWPSNIMYRDDIGDRLEEELPILQEHGYATGMEYE